MYNVYCFNVSLDLFSSVAHVEYVFIFNAVFGTIVRESNSIIALPPEVIVGAGFVLVYVPADSTTLKEPADAVPTFVIVTLGSTLKLLVPLTE